MGREKHHRQASFLLMDWFRSYFPSDETDMKKLRSITRNSLSALRRQLAGTIEAVSPDSTKKLTGRSKLNDKKQGKIDVTNQSQNSPHPKRLASLR